MRRYTITVNDAPYEIDVEEITADTFEVHLNGETIPVRLTDHADLAQAMITPDLEVHSERISTPSALPTASRPRKTTGSVPKAVSAPRTAADATGALTAPMPGVILSVEKKVGDTVARGDVVVVLEAMKMKNSLCAPAAGTVASITCAIGDQVKYGDTLVTFA